MLENESGANGAVDASSEAEVTEVKQAEGQEATEAKETEVVEAQEDKTTGEEQVKRKRPSGFHRKISKLEQQLAEKDARLAEVEQKLNTTQKVDKEPVLEDFESFDAFNRALVRYEANQILKQERQQAKAQEEEQKVISRQREAEISWDKKLEALDEAYDDYEEVVSKYKDVPVRQEIINATADSDIGPQIRYYLAKNPEVLDGINNQSVNSFTIYKKIAELEAQLSAKPAVKVSKSSEPITPLKGSSKTAVKLESLDTDAFLAQRHSHLFGGRKY